MEEKNLKNEREIAEATENKRRDDEKNQAASGTPKDKGSVFTAKKLALIAAFTALAYGVSFIEFPVFPAAPFLKLDFSFAVMLIAAYMLGALSGEIIVIVFSLLKLPFSQTGMIGEAANFIMAQFFVVLPALVYGFKRKFSVVIISLCSSAVIISALSLVVNRYFLFPFYMQDGAAAFFNNVWYFVVAFNVIKCAANAVITVLLYKKLKKILHKFL